jgi:hypothetical protein
VEEKMSEKFSESHYFNRGITILVGFCFAVAMLTIGSCELKDRQLEGKRYETIAQMVENGASPLEATMAVGVATETYPEDSIGRLIILHKFKNG